MANRSKVSANKVASSAIEDAELAQIAQSEAWHIMLALKSGMLSEASWAIDSLNVLLHDDSTASYFNLKNMPGLLDTLTDYFGHYLYPMFGLSTNSYHYKRKCKRKKTPRTRLTEPSEKEDDKNVVMKMLDDEDHTWVSRKGKPVLVDPNTINSQILVGSCENASSSRCQVEIPKEITMTHMYQLDINTDETMTSYMENLKQDDLKRVKYFGLCNGPERRFVADLKYCNDNCVCLRKEWPYEDVREPRSSASRHLEREEYESRRGMTLNGHCNGPTRMNGGGKVKINGLDVKEEDEDDTTDKEETDRSEDEDESNNENDEPEEADVNTSLDSVEAPFIAMDADMFHDSLPCCRTGLCSNSPRKKFKEEAVVNDSSPFRLLGEGKFEQARRCLCISNVFRSLSFVAGNDSIMAYNDTLIGILSRILLLEHRHEIRTENRPFERDESDAILPMDTSEKNDQWWFLTLKLIRENALVVMANICNKLVLFHRNETITLPLLDGLIHWAICPSSEAVDPLSNSILSLQRLALEALCKLCMSRENVDLLIATPPYCRLATFISTLVTFLSDKDQVLKEFAVVIFSYLVQGDTVVARTIGLYEQSVSLLIDFVETAEQKASQIASEQGVHKFLENPEKMGTSLDMLRRAANTLVCIARVPESRQIFLRNEERLLALVMSQILDQQVAQTLSEVLFQCTSAPMREITDA